VAIVAQAKAHDARAPHAGRLAGGRRHEIAKRLAVLALRRGLHLREEGIHRRAGLLRLVGLGGGHGGHCISERGGLEGGVGVRGRLGRRGGWLRLRAEAARRRRWRRRRRGRGVRDDAGVGWREGEDLRWRWGGRWR